MTLIFKDVLAVICSFVAFLPRYLSNSWQNCKTRNSLVVSDNQETDLIFYEYKSPLARNVLTRNEYVGRTQIICDYRSLSFLVQ